MDVSTKSGMSVMRRRSVPFAVAFGMMLLAAVMTLVGAVTGYFMALTMLGKAPLLELPAQAALAAQPMAPVELPDVMAPDTLKGARDYLRAGPADAKVQVVLFEDAQCPYCKQLSAGPVRQMLDAYLPTGHVAVTYRHYAFLDDWSTKIALAMECAGKEGRFWAYHDLVFDDATAAGGGELSDARLAGWAEIVKLDADAFAACMADPGTRALVASDLDAGRALRVQGTPTIFVNGKRLIGNVPYDYLKSAIDEALRTAS